MDIIFTPDNEPYLGLETLHAFDRAIISAMRANEEAAKLSRGSGVSSLQRAACVVIPQGMSIALSIRELIRQGYLFGAQVLMRPLAERVIIIMYLDQNPGRLKEWNQGRLPSLAKMISRVSDEKFSGHDVKKKMDVLIHGSIHSAPFNLRGHQEARSGYSSSKILENPQLCSQVSLDGAAWLCSLMGMMCKIFNLQDEAKP